MAGLDPAIQARVGLGPRVEPGDDEMVRCELPDGPHPLAALGPSPPVRENGSWPVARDRALTRPLTLGLPPSFAAPASFLLSPQRGERRNEAGGGDALARGAGGGVELAPSGGA